MGSQHEAEHSVSFGMADGGFARKKDDTSGKFFIRIKGKVYEQMGLDAGEVASPDGANGNSNRWRTRSQRSQKNRPIIMVNGAKGGGKG